MRLSQHRTFRRLAIAVIVGITFWLTFYCGYVSLWIDYLFKTELSKWGHLIIRESSQIVLILLATVVISKMVKKPVFSLLGVDKNPFPGFIKALISVSPMLAGYGILFSFDSSFTFYEAFSGSVFPGLTEELIFRAFFFGIFFYQIKVGFIPAILLVSLIFGSLHLSQSAQLIESAGIFAITALGSGFFAWLYVEWGKDLYFPIFLHMLMNFSWGIYETGVATALGGWGMNILRFMTVGFAIYITVRYGIKSGSFLSGKLLSWKLDERNISECFGEVN